MTVRRIDAAGLAAAIMVIIFFGATSALGQPSGGEKPRLGESPQEMVQTALDSIESGDLQQAAVLIQRAKVLNPKLPKLLLAEGLLKMSAGKTPRGYQTNYISEAIGKLQEYTTKTDEGRNDYRGFAALGTIYKESRTFRMAIPPFEAAKKLAPAEENGRFVRAEIALDLAFSYMGLDRKKEALETAKEAELLAPGDPKIQLGLARVSSAAEDFAGAESAAKKSVDWAKAKLQGRPLDREMLSTLQGGYDLIIGLKNFARQTSPDDGALLFAIASATRDNADVIRRLTLLAAREYALQAIDREPKKYEWQIYTAQLEADLGAYPEAVKRLNDLLKESPDNQEAAKLLEILPVQPAAARPK